MLTREQAMQKLRDAHPDAYLLQHSASTEAIMRALAKRFDADAEGWGICGLLHDVDFPQTKNCPEQHGLKAAEMLEGLPEEYLRAIAAHNGEMTGVQPKSQLDFALRCAETVTGMISAAALVRPEGMQGMLPKSIKKKMKDKAFAAAVNRENIKECEKIGLSLDDFLEISIKAMTEQVH